MMACMITVVWYFVPQKKCLFLAVWHCPFQLDSVELFIEWGNLFCVWHLTHSTNIWSTKLQHVFWHRICVFCSSTDPLVADFFPFQVIPSHMAWSLDTVTNIFHDNASMNFLFTCVSVLDCVCSLPGEVIPSCSHSYQTIMHNLSGYK